MSKLDISLIEDYIRVFNEGDSSSIEKLKTVFLDDLPSKHDGESMLTEIEEGFSLDELPVICAKLVLTITASCAQDDFHDWDYEHLGFIIELSNKYDFKIPQKLLNGLPSQLLLLVDSDKIDDSSCK